MSSRSGVQGIPAIAGATPSAVWALSESHVQTPITKKIRFTFIEGIILPTEGQDIRHAGLTW